VDPVARTVVLIHVAIAHPYGKLELNTNEGYLLSIQQQDDKVVSPKVDEKYLIGHRRKNFQP